MILGIDSATPVAGVAVINDTQILGEIMLNTGNTHSEKLMPMLVQLLDNLSIDINQLDAIAVMEGPGSFTGLRIGMATAKALAQGANKEFVMVPTLDCMAYNLMYYPGIVCPILNAQKKQVYTALYQTVNGVWVRKSDYQAISVMDLSKQLLELGQPVWFCGDGVAVFQDVLKESLKDLCHFVPIQHNLTRAASLCMLALERVKNNQCNDLYHAEPFYIRKSEAEVQWNLKHNIVSD